MDTPSCPIFPAQLPDPTARTSVTAPHVACPCLPPPFPAMFDFPPVNSVPLRHCPKNSSSESPPAAPIRSLRLKRHLQSAIPHSLSFNLYPSLPFFATASTRYRDNSLPKFHRCRGQTFPAKKTTGSIYSFLRISPSYPSVLPPYVRARPRPLISCHSDLS